MTSPSTPLAPTGSLRARLGDDMKTALKSGDKARLAALRLLLSSIRQREIDERITLDDAGVVGVIEKMLKQRRDSVSQFEAAARHDLADIEKAEMQTLAAYMPQALGAEEIEALIGAALDESGARGPADMGKLMALLKPRLAGRADMAAVSLQVKARLATPR